MKKTHLVMAVHITDRLRRVPDVQQLFSEFGCYIKVRLGLHEAQDTVCSPNGLILLDMLYDPKACGELADKLSAIEGVEVKTIEFGHEG
jgi:hypothetical protein